MASGMEKVWLDGSKSDSFVNLSDNGLGSTSKENDVMAGRVTG